MKPGKQTDVAKEFGVSRTAIYNLVKDKDYRIQFTPSGKIDIDGTIEALRKSGFPNSNNKKRKKYKYSDETAPTPEEHTADLNSEGPLKSTDSRERIEKHKAFQQAEKFRLENEEKKKKLIDITELTDSVFNFIRQFAEHQQNQKDRIGSKIEAAETRHEIERILEDDNYHGLKTIADSFDLDEEAVKKKILQRLIR